MAASALAAVQEKVAAAGGKAVQIPGKRILVLIALGPEDLDHPGWPQSLTLGRTVVPMELDQIQRSQRHGVKDLLHTLVDKDPHPTGFSPGKAGHCLRAQETGTFVVKNKAQKINPQVLAQKDILLTGQAADFHEHRHLLILFPSFRLDNQRKG